MGVEPSLRHYGMNGMRLFGMSSLIHIPLNSHSLKKIYLLVAMILYLIPLRIVILAPRSMFYPSRPFLQISCEALPAEFVLALRAYGMSAALDEKVSDQTV